MSFEWLNKFHNNRVKSADYAEKTLASYRLGMKAKGSIAGVRIATTPQSCAAIQPHAGNKRYHPDDAPHIPLPDCPHATTCPCVYRPVMTYEGGGMKDEG